MMTAAAAAAAHNSSGDGCITAATSAFVQGPPVCLRQKLAGMVAAATALLLALPLEAAAADVAVVLPRRLEWILLLDCLLGFV
jgi:hypothetical protein